MFSIVIPAYNAANFISTSIDSVLNQTYTNFELIIVDDGSTDMTKSIIDQYDDERIRYMFQDNAGVSAARNKGILESRGKYICFLDSDDEWYVNHLAELSSLIEEYTTCGLYITGYDIRLNNGDIVHKSQQILKKICKEHITSNNGYDVLLNNGYFFNTNTVCCKKEVFDKVGLFKVGVKNGEDDDMWFRIFAYYSIAISKKVTTIYNRTNCGATGQRVEVFESTFLGRIESLLNSSEIPQYRKDSLLIWVERNKLSRARKYILAGNKLETLKLFKKIEFRKVSKKKYFETLFCLLVPTKIVQRYIDKRDAGYYR